MHSSGTWDVTRNKNQCGLDLSSVQGCTVRLKHDAQMHACGNRWEYAICISYLGGWTTLAVCIKFPIVLGFHNRGFTGSKPTHVHCILYCYHILDFALAFE